jgi:hypothetical protein
MLHATSKALVQLFVACNTNSAFKLSAFQSLKSGVRTAAPKNRVRTASDDKLDESLGPRLLATGTLLPFLKNTLSANLENASFCHYHKIAELLQPTVSELADECDSINR